MPMQQEALEISEEIIAVAGMVFLLVFPIVLAYSRRVWKRASPPHPDHAIADHQSAERMLQMQQSIDAMAIEIERISEGQRFVTALMSERAPVALPKSADSAKPIRATD